MIIRRASVEDAAAISRISREDLGYPCQPELVASRLEGLDLPREAVFVAQVEQEVVGYIHAEKYNTLYFESMVNLLGLAVLADYRRQGIGKTLLSQAESWAREQGIRLVRLNSGASRKGAHAFYRAMGYKDEKEQLRFLKEL